MRKQKLGKDLQVSAVGLGCMGMTHAYGKPADKEEMKKIYLFYLSKNTCTREEITVKAPKF